MSSPDFDTALSDYNAALTTLETSAKPSAEEALATLTTRDRVQHSVDSASSTANLMQLVVLDKRLHELRDKLLNALDIEAYRTILKPSEDAWWWYLEPSTHWLDRFDWVWQAATLVLLTPSVSLIVDISSKFLVTVPDTFGSFAIVGQSAMALLAGGSLTDKGRQIIQTVLTNLRIPRYLWRETQTLMSLILFISLLGFRLSLTSVAQGYLKQGDADYEQREFASAESNYRRALDLWPDMVECNTRLGGLYEDLGAVEKAKEKYRLAVQGGDLIAFNNLARLYNLEKDYTEAFRLLWSGKKKVDETNDNDLKVSWYKNIGWARYGQKRYEEAEAQLNKAIDIGTQAKLPTSPEETPHEEASEQSGSHNHPSATTIPVGKDSLGSAYCLRAQVYTALKQTTKIAEDWDNCNTYANPSLPEADQWIGLAKAYERSQSISDVDSTKPQGEKP